MVTHPSQLTLFMKIVVLNKSHIELLMVMMQFMMNLTSKHLTDLLSFL